MLFGHACKVKSGNAVKVSEEMYAHYKDIVSCDAFENGLQEARNQLGDEHVVMDYHCYQKEFELPLKRNMFGLFVLPVYVNHTLCRFIIDTGAQISGIRENIARGLALPAAKGSLSIGSIGGTQKTMKGVLLNSFQFGAIEYRNLPLIVLNDEDFSLRFGKIDLFAFDGILGWDILSQLDFELDDIAKKFIVLKNRLRITHPNMLKGSFPCFIMKHANGDCALYGFDSGSKISWIGEEAIQTHGYHVAGETTTLGFGVHGKEKLHMKVVESCTLYLDKAKITLSNTMSGRTKLFSSFTFDGVLGNEICAGRRIRIINSANMVLIA